MKPILFLTGILFSCCSIYAQTITGHWIGKCYCPETKADTTFVFLDLRQDSASNRITGISMCRNGDFYGKTTIYGWYKVKEQRYHLVEDKIMAISAPERSTLVRERYVLQLTQTAQYTMLSGTSEYSNHNRGSRWDLDCDGNRTIILFRTADSIDSE